MPTQHKIDTVAEYADKFKQAKSVYLTDFSGIDVITITEIRKKFREAEIEYRVLKNRLAKRSLNDAGITDLDPYLRGVTSFIIGYDDPAAPAKLLKEFNKKNDVLKVKAVYFEGKTFTAEEAVKLADLPSREVLLAQLVGLLQSPMTKLAGTLGAAMTKLAGTLDAVKNSKSE
jgi:large subunit ribosomal protein L10